MDSGNDVGFTGSPDGVEIGVWCKASYSQSVNDCVELAPLTGGRVGVRDSKNPAQRALLLGGAQFGAFLAAVKASQLG